MRGMFLAILLLAVPPSVFALTWDFVEETTWGWAAQEGAGASMGGTATTTTVRSEVADGVWRIAPALGSRYPSIELLSPLIGEDSALFDHVTLRLRLIHHSPTEGWLQMSWFNAERRRLYEMNEFIVPGYVVTPRPGPVFTTDWQDITIALDQEGLAWQDTLFHFELYLGLNSYAEGPEDFPDFLEVDWIQLTGTEELVLGELSPREVAVGSGRPGVLLADPVFSPLGGGVDNSGIPFFSYGALGDVDGDGDVDLVTAVSVHQEDLLVADQMRLTVASNDGQGRFRPTQRILRQASLFQLQGHDFNGDGLLDLVLTEGLITELWYNRGEAGFEPIMQLPSGAWLLSLADGDGDGDVDLVVAAEEGEWEDATSSATLWANDGEGGFVEGDRLVLNGYVPVLPAGQPLGEAVRLLWNRRCGQPLGPWRLSRPWAAQPEPAFFFEAAVNPCALHLLADLDGNGHVDLLGSPERNLRPRVYFNTYHGLELWRLDASGVVAHHTLFDSEVFFSSRGIARDLNGDGLLDVALVDINLATGPALVVLLGQRDGVPVLEGRYPLLGKGRQVLAGDVDGDGADDLVVLGISAEAGEGLEPGAGNDGVFVFINQSSPVTVVASEVAVPTAFSLDANYPNPFNPATTIPLSVPADAEDVELAIYNVLGQPVRQVWTGALAAGEHRLGWDGRDALGQPVAAGVYLYRLQVGEQARLRKMVKLD